MYLDLVALKLFIDVVDLGSYRKTATRNRLSMSVIASRIAQLEHAMCAPLLKRHSGSIITTPLGLRLHAVSSELLGTLAAEVHELSQRPGSKSGKVNLCLNLDPAEPSSFHNDTSEMGSVVAP